MCSATAAAAAGDPIRTPFPVPPVPGEAIEIAEGVLWLRLPLPMKLDHVNIYALDEGDGWTVIDTGFDTRRSRAALEAALAGPLGGRKVRRVVVTHHHPDHVGLAGWLIQRFDAPLLMPRTAWLMARMLTLDEQPQVVPEVARFWRRAGMEPAILEKRLAERPFNFADVVHPLPLGFIRLKEGERITLGGRRWIVRMGDGHAPEHATFWEEGGDLVIGGDQLLPSISPNLGVYATEPEADPVGDWLASCRRFATFAEERHLVLPGHKLPFTGLPMRLSQLTDNHLSALERLRAFLTRPRSAAECFVPIFRREIGEGEYGLALVEAVAHLNHLLARGEVERTLDPAGVWLFKLRADAAKEISTAENDGAMPQ